jgi:hypothetical protein
MKSIKLPSKYTPITNKFSLPLEIWLMIQQHEKREINQRIAKFSQIWKPSHQLTSTAKWIYIRSSIKHLETISGISFSSGINTSRINYEAFYEYDENLCVSLVYFYGMGYSQHIL